MMLMISDKLLKNFKRNRLSLMKKPEDLKKKERLLKTSKREKLLKQSLPNKRLPKKPLLLQKLLPKKQELRLQLRLKP